MSEVYIRDLKIVGHVDSMLDEFNPNGILKLRHSDVIYLSKIRRSENNNISPFRCRL